MNLNETSMDVYRHYVGKARNFKEFKDFCLMNNIHVRCIRCNEDALSNCYSLAGAKEVGISGFCEKCFDEIFK